nr:hypothetical protein [Candidatus Gracilibacteria bacterium]
MGENIQVYAELRKAVNGEKRIYLNVSDFTQKQSDAVRTILNEGHLDQKELRKSLARITFVVARILRDEGFKKPQKNIESLNFQVGDKQPNTFSRGDGGVLAKAISWYKKHKK